MSGQIECPHCGKRMAIGYASCLSCKKPLPTKDSPLKKIARSKRATYVVMPEETKPKWPWLVLAIALGSIVLFFFNGSQKQPKATTETFAPQTSVTYLEPQNQTTANTSAIPSPNETTKKEVDFEKLSTLNQALSEMGLYSSVSPEGENKDIAVIESASCGNDKMKQVIDGQKPDLKDGGFAKIQCFAKHGALVFENDL